MRIARQGGQHPAGGTGSALWLAACEASGVARFAWEAERRILAAHAVVVVIADGPSCMQPSLPVEACGTLHAVPLHRPP